MGPKTTGAQFQEDIASLLYPPDEEEGAENEEDERDKNDEAE